MRKIDTIRKQLKRLYPIAFKVILDVLFYNISNLLSILLRFDFVFQSRFLHVDNLPGILENGIFILLEFLFRLPLQMWEFVSIREILDLFYVLTLSKLITLPIFYMMRPNISWSRGAYVISWILGFAILAGIRIFIRVIYGFKKKLNYSNIEKRIKNVLVIGAGDAGEKVIREIINRPELKYKVVGLLDDDPQKIGLKLHNFTVLGKIERISEIINEYNIDVIIYAIPSAPKEVLRRVVLLSSRSRAEIKEVPALWELIDGKVSIDDIRNVQLEDLLSRASIKMDISPVKELIGNKIILITGAGGSIGSEIARQISMLNPKELILLDRAESRIFDIEREIIELKKFNRVKPLICDIRDSKKVEKIFENYKPQIVFHAAALKHVPLMEKNPDEAVLNNIFGTKNLLDASIMSKVNRFINISTDKAVNPTSIMGASKRVAEIMVHFYSKEYSGSVFTSVRFGNVLGSDGSVVDVFKKQLRETGIITITDPKMERYFMLIPEAVELVLQASAIDAEGGNIYILQMGEPVNIKEFAETFIKLSGFEVGNEIKIKVVGNRGGEKLKEELWSKNEEVLQTEIPYILKIKTNSFTDEDNFYNKLKQLKAAAEKMDYTGIRKLLKSIIPESNL